jgi:hypothetical protein
MTRHSSAWFHPRCKHRSPPSGRPDARRWCADRLRARRGAHPRDPGGRLCPWAGTNHSRHHTGRGLARRCQGRPRNAPAQGLLDRDTRRISRASSGPPPTRYPRRGHDRCVHSNRRKPAWRCNRHLRSRRHAQAPGNGHHNLGDLANLHRPDQFSRGYRSRTPLETTKEFEQRARNGEGGTKIEPGPNMEAQ